MKKLILAALICSATFFTGCKKEKDTTFLITKNGIGRLDKTSLARDIELIFAQDSVVKDTISLNLGNRAKKIKIYERVGGGLLLTLTPSADSIPVIENIRIEDQRFQTEKGININSTFKDIKDNYSISKIITSFNNVVILIKNSDVYFTIAKEELPSSLRYSSSVNIEAVQIPDNAKIKYMMVGWD